MKIRNSILAGVALGLLATSSAGADTAKVATLEPAAAAKQELSLDAIVKKHITAMGGEKLLRAGTSITFTVSGEKMGKKFTKTVVQARPDLMRVDVATEEGPMSKGFDGKVGWYKKGTEAAVQMTDEESASMKSHAQFEEPLLDYAKKGTKVRLVGTSEVDAKPAYDLELTLASGEVEHHFLDAKSFLLVKKTFTVKDKDKKSKAMSVRFGNYKRVQGRMVNHSVTWDGDDGKSYTSVVSKVAYDRKYNAKLFAMPK